MILPLAFLLLSGATHASSPKGELWLGRSAELALACVHKEYPNKIAHVLNDDTDVKAPHELTPAFYGCYDWHSSVHGHWLLARVARVHAQAPFVARARAALDKSLTEANIAGEVRYLTRTGRVSFERPYGLAWLFQLHRELREWAAEKPDDRDIRRWAETLEPLTRVAVARIADWLPKLTAPIRIGEHSQTAFSFGLMLDWARATGDQKIASLLVSRARDFYAKDRACPMAYEPSGEDFLSPCIAEADLMRRVLPQAEFVRWLGEFLPLIPTTARNDWLTPGVVTDPSDPKLGHLYGLNLSRAWMLNAIATSLPSSDSRGPALIAAARRHYNAGMEGVTGEHYEGGHWLGTFAVYLETNAGLPSSASASGTIAPANEQAPGQHAAGQAPKRVVPPLPPMESLEAPEGWKPDGHVVPHMPATLLRLPRTPLTRAKYPAIDFHVHAGTLKTVEAYHTFIKKMDEAGLGAIINLNGGTGANLDETLKAGEGFKDRVANFITFSAEGINEPGWSEKFAAEMERGFKAGAQGLKVSKALGLTAKNPDGTYIQCDDPRLDAVWAMAAKYNAPVMIHVSDSIGRFYPISPKNERYEAGLWDKPGDTTGNYYKNGYPSPEVIERARENMHRKHPKTRFVNAHLAMLYYDPEKLAKFLDTYPNADVEVSATIQDLGRAPRMWREFLIKYQDRVLMGSDGSPERGVKDFWEPHWRFFETLDEYFEHPAQVRTPGGSPGHGRWNISGAALPDEVIRKIYYENALRHLPALKASITSQLRKRSE